MTTHDQPHQHPTCQLGEEQFVLLPGGAAWWPGRRALIVADPHWGKASAFRDSGIPVPETIGEDLKRLSLMLTRCRADRLYVLGDLAHTRGAWSPTIVKPLEQFRLIHADLEITVVRGNHDTAAGDPPASLRFTCVDEPCRAGPITLRHHPDQHPAGPTLCGHLHPAVRIGRSSRTQIRRPCFHLRNDQLTLPAFGSFTGRHTLRLEPGDDVFVLTDDAVIDVNAIGGNQVSVNRPAHSQDVSAPDASR